MPHDANKQAPTRARQGKVFTCNIQHGRSRSRKEASKKGTASADVVVQSFHPYLEQTPHRRRRRPHPTREAGNNNGLAVAPPRPPPLGTSSRRSAGRSPSGSPPLPEMAKSANSSQIQSAPPWDPARGRERQMAGRREPGSEEARVTQPTIVPIPA
jgi:hypothetical protein